MTKYPRQPFLALLKVALLGVSFPLLLTSHNWVQASKQDNSLVYAQTPAQSPLQPSKIATPQPSQPESAKKTNPPTQEKKQEERKKSEQQKMQDLSLIVLGVMLGEVVVVYLGVLWLRPLWLLWLPGEFKLPKLGIIPEFKLPLPVLLWLKYRPRVLDFWVKKHIDTFALNFVKNETVAERKYYVSIPVLLDTEEIKELTAETLRKTFKQKRVRLLIWGEGGSGKTALACQIAKWAMADEQSKRLTEHKMLPILIEQELDSDLGEGKKPLMEAIAGEIQDACDNEQLISDELLEQLLRQRRILVIVDHLSEMSTHTRNKIKPAFREFPANALVITSRIEENFKGIDTKIETLRFDGEELVSFIKNYLKQLEKWHLFENEDEPGELLQECAKLQRIVGDKKTITVLLAKLYAERMINAKENISASARSLDNIPDLMLDHLEKLNRQAERVIGQEYPTLKDDAKVIAWKCLEREYKPSYVEREAVVKALGEIKADVCLQYFEGKLHLIKSGYNKDTISFALDPLAEYLAGLYLVDSYGENETSWREFLAQAESKPQEEIKGFLLAVRDCCLAKGSQAKVPGFVAEELGKLAGLDLEALKQEQLKRRIRRLTDDLFVPEVEDRRRAAEELGKIGVAAKFAAPTLLRALKDEDSEVRAIAASTLGKLGNTSEPVLQGLLALLQNEDSYVRLCAAEALGKLGNASEPVLQGLQALLQDQDSWVREEAVKVLEKLRNIFVII
jgi:GTPase SAR1 family protein